MYFFKSTKSLFLITVKLIAISIDIVALNYLLFCLIWSITSCTCSTHLIILRFFTATFNHPNYCYCYYCYSCSVCVLIVVKKSQWMTSLTLITVSSVTHSSSSTTYSPVIKTPFNSLFPAHYCAFPLLSQSTSCYDFIMFTSTFSID